MDYSLFTYNSDTLCVFVLVYIDDIIITGSDSQAVHYFIDQLQNVFPIKDLGELSFFLNVEAIRNQAGLHLRQTKYITDFLNSTYMLGARPLRCPSFSGSKLSSTAGELLKNLTEYR